MAEITGTTRTAAVIGAPVRHSRSPLLANAAFSAGKLDWTMVALEVAPGSGAGAVEAARLLGLGGLMVTMPHKADVMDALDSVTPVARRLGAVNSVAWEGEHLVGDNTDGAGLVASLRIDSGIDVTDRACTVLGAGGAARAVVLALAEAGAGRVSVVNRTPDRAEVAAALAGPVGHVGSPNDIASSEIVINATSVGMGSEPGAQGPIPLDPELLHRGQTVVDLVYQPLDTPLLLAARQRGATACDGLGMLVHQAALTIERWTGTAPDLAAMTRAARLGP